MTLAGKIAIITGAGRGIGNVVAETLAREGAKLVLNYSRSREETEKLAEKLRKLNVEVLTVQGDVSKWDDVQSMVKKTLDKFGKIDILYNNAGVLHRVEPDDLTLEMWDRCIAVNLTGSYHCIRAVVETMKKQRSGRIINTVSVGGMRGMKTLDYSASKGGVVALTKSAAQWLAPYGIMVNAVCPGLVATDMGLTNPDLKRIEARVPLGRLCQPEDLAKASLFLASDASFMTGQILIVDGGQFDTYSARG